MQNDRVTPMRLLLDRAVLGTGVEGGANLPPWGVVRKCLTGPEGHFLLPCAPKPLTSVSSRGHPSVGTFESVKGPCPVNRQNVRDGPRCPSCSLMARQVPGSRAYTPNAASTAPQGPPPSQPVTTEGSVMCPFDWLASYTEIFF